MKFFQCGCDICFGPLYINSLFLWLFALWMRSFTLVLDWIFGWKSGSLIFDSKFKLELPTKRLDFFTSVFIHPLCLCSFYDFICMDLFMRKNEQPDMEVNREQYNYTFNNILHSLMFFCFLELDEGWNSKEFMKLLYGEYEGCVFYIFFFVLETGSNWTTWMSWYFFKRGELYFKEFILKQ